MFEKKQSIFLILAVLLCLLIGGFVVWSIVSIGGTLESALEVPAPSAAAVKFDTQGFESLKLIK
ncbi:MAG: hypothetical protein AAB700_01995 [Patescibacteria group bacterium]